MLYNKLKSRITCVKNHLGVLTDKPGEIENTFVKHFQNILNNHEGSNIIVQVNLLRVIPKVVTQENNKSLKKPITLEKVNKVVFDMNLDKYLGPDGFQAFFFQKC